eukprot:COSAG04_NODE_186_length_21024_cov_6.326069_9_plen_523_part_00
MILYRFVALSVSLIRKASPFQDWFDSQIPVTSVVASNHTLFADTTTAGYVNASKHFNAGARFRFLNAPEFLVRPGLFWLDTETEFLYMYLNKTGDTTGACTLAVAPTALTITGAVHISVTGFTIDSAQRTIVSIANSSFVSLSNCTVRNGMDGIDVDGGEHVSISDSEVKSLGGTAISIEGGDRPSLRRGDHSVTNCTIHDYARVHWCYQPGVELKGVGHTVANNEIHTAPHQGILVSGNDHTIHRNVLHDLLLSSFDSGAIYKSDRDWTTRGLVVSSNFFYDLGSTSPADKCGVKTSCCRHAIYMDATEHGFTAMGNLIVQPPALRSSACNYGVFDNGGRNNKISSNLCVGYETCVRLFDYNIACNRSAFSFGMVRNLEPYHYRSPPYDKYPGLAAMDPNISLPLIGNCSQREECGAAPWFDEISSNVGVLGSVDVTQPLGAPSNIPNRFNVTANANVTLAQAGFEAADPLAKNCWGMRSDSAVFGLSPGFAQIHPELMGPPAFRAAFVARCMPAQNGGGS